MAHRSQKARAVLSFIGELLVYSVFVVGYFFLVLHFLGDSLQELFKTHRTIYAFLALALMVGQGFLLEALTTALFKFIRNRVH
jgi:hypothetical protein